MSRWHNVVSRALSLVVVAGAVAMAVPSVAPAGASSSTVTVTFKTYFFTKTATQVVSAAPGSTVTAPTDPGVPYPEYAFTGWHCVGIGMATTIQVGTTPIVCNAIFSPYHLLYYGMQAKKVNAGQRLLAGTSVTLPMSAGARWGYRFVGWNLGHRVLAPGATFSMPNANLDIKAVWLRTIPKG